MALGILVCGAPVRAADAPAIYQAPPLSSKVLVQGDSSVHKWEMNGKIIAGTVEFAVPVNFDTNQTTLTGLKDGALPATVHAIIPVRSLKSEAEVKPEYMEGLMQQAMKETNFARIEYRITELTLKQPHAPGTPFEFDAKGELTIAGVTNKVDFPVTIAPAGAEKIEIKGEANLKMTAYGITPPAPNFGLGLMKCEDDIKIIIDWLLAKKQP